MTIHILNEEYIKSYKDVVKKEVQAKACMDVQSSMEVYGNAKTDRFRVCNIQEIANVKIQLCCFSTKGDMQPI